MDCAGLTPPIGRLPPRPVLRLLTGLSKETDLPWFRQHRYGNDDSFRASATHIMSPHSIGCLQPSSSPVKTS